MDPQDQFDSDFRLYHEIQAVHSTSGVRSSYRAPVEYPSPLEVSSPQEDHFDFLRMVSLAIQISLESQEGKKFQIGTTFHDTISGTIGEGGNAFVKPVGLVTETSRGRIVAAKIRHYHQHQGYNLNHENWRLWMQESIAELLILRHDKTLNHENIINLLGLNLVPATNGSDALWPMFLYENSELGSLADYQSNNPPLSLDQKLEILLGIFSALETLHEVGVIHGDVKTENVLLFPGRKNLVPKLSDFGGSRFIISDSRRFLGTFLWCAPEVFPNGFIISEQLDGTATDTYSAGLLAWRLFLDGQNPFHTILDGPWDDIVEFGKRVDEIKRSQENKLLDLSTRIVSKSFNDRSKNNLLNILQSSIHVDPSFRKLSAITKFLRRTVNASDSDNILDSARVPTSDITDTSSEKLNFINMVSVIENLFLTTEKFRQVNTLVSDFGMSIILKELEQLSTFQNIHGFRAKETLVGFYLCGLGHRVDHQKAMNHYSSICLTDWKISEIWKELLQYKSIFYRFHNSLAIDQDLSTMREVMAEAILMGSTVAFEDLFAQDPEYALNQRQLFFLVHKGIVCNNPETHIPETYFSHGRHKASSPSWDILNRMVITGNTLELDNWPDWTTAINTYDNLGQGLLFIACRAGQSEVVKLLVQKGADIAAKTSSGETCLHHLHNFQDKESILELTALLYHPDTINAVAQSSLFEVECIMPGTPISWAVYRGDTNAVKSLLSHGAIILTQDSTPEILLRVAASQCHHEIVQLLIEPTIASLDPELEVKCFAVLVEALIKRTTYQRIQSKGRSYISDTRATLDAIVNHLTMSKIDEGLRSVTGANLLSFATVYGDQDIIEHILDKFCENDINIRASVDLSRSNVRMTPLEIALARGHRDIFLMLLHRTDISTHEDSSVYLRLCIQQTRDTAFLDPLLQDMLKRKISLDTPHHGRTPYDEALDYASFGFAKILKENNAKTDWAHQVLAVTKAHVPSRTPTPRFPDLVQKFITLVPKVIQEPLRIILEIIINLLRLVNQILFLLLTSKARAEANRFDEEYRKGKPSLTLLGQVLLSHRNPLGEQLDVLLEDSPFLIEYGSAHSYSIIQALEMSLTTYSGHEASQITTHLNTVCTKYGAAHFINWQSKFGSTALHLAVQKLHLDAIEVLLNNGALINLRDEFGRTALDLTFEKLWGDEKSRIQEEKVATLLIERGGKRASEVEIPNTAERVWAVISDELRSKALIPFSDNILSDSRTAKSIANIIHRALLQSELWGMTPALLELYASSFTKPENQIGKGLKRNFTILNQIQTYLRHHLKPFGVELRASMPALSYASPWHVVLLGQDLERILPDDTKDNEKDIRSLLIHRRMDLMDSRSDDQIQKDLYGMFYKLRDTPELLDDKEMDLFQEFNIERAFPDPRLDRDYLKERKRRCDERWQEWQARNTQQASRSM